MLIDTKQIITLTDLRLQAGAVARQAQGGRKFFISDKGKIIAAVVSENAAYTNDRKELFTRLRRLQEKMDYKPRGKKGWDSTKVIRKMRDDRTKYLLKREEML